MERRGKVDRAQLVIGLVQIVVDDPCIEPVGLADFGGGVGQAAGDARLVVRAAPAQPAFQFAQGRRQEKDVLPARERKVQLGRALNVDVEQDVLPGFQGFEHGGQRRPVIIAVHVGPFREKSGFPAAEELFDRKEMVVLAVRFMAARGPGGAGDGIGEVREFVPQALDERCLSRP